MRISGARTCVTALLMCLPLLAQEETPDKRLSRTAETLHQISGAQLGIPIRLFERAQCIVVIPNVKKAAVLVGGAYGRGFAMCRLPGSWSAPAPVRITGGSFGLQLGADSTDIVLLVMNEHGLERLLADKVSLGVDVNVAAGPVGRDANADTDALLHAEILAWSRSRGVFAGVALNGTVIEHDKAEAQKLYGRPWSNREIIRGGVGAPDPAKVLSTELARDVYRK